MSAKNECRAAALVGGKAARVNVAPIDLIVMFLLWGGGGGWGVERDHIYQILDPLKNQISDIRSPKKSNIIYHGFAKKSDIRLKRSDIRYQTRCTRSTWLTFDLHTKQEQICNNLVSISLELLQIKPSIATKLYIMEQ